MITFKEFLAADRVKPQTTLLKSNEPKLGFKVPTDFSKKSTPIFKNLKQAAKPPSPTSASSKRQRLTNPKNRFKIRQGSSLDSTSNNPL